MSEMPSSGDLTPYHFLCLAVGSLFLNWATFETSLTAGLKVHLLGRMAHSNRDERTTAAKLVAAIYGGQRMKSARDTIKRLAKVEGIDQAARDFFEAAFAHVGHIEDLRDKIAHQGLELTNDDHVWQLHDIMTTRALAESKFYQIDTIAIHRAGADLRTANERLSGFLHEHITEGREFDLTPIAWQYKPAMLKPLSRKIAVSRQAPWRLPLPSDE